MTLRTPRPRGATPLPNPAPPRAWDLSELTATTPAGPAGRTAAGGPRGFTPAEVQQLREEWQEQQVRALADARRIAFEEGRAAGRAEAQQAADDRVRESVDALVRAVGTVRSHEAHYVGILEENLTALACAVARHVIEREVRTDAAVIRALVDQAIAAFPQGAPLRIRLHPADHALIAAGAASDEVSWLADPRIARGGCLVEGRDRLIDGRVDVALEQLFRAITRRDA